MPLKARTWPRRGCTPVLRVSGKGYRRVSLAGLIALKPASRTRLIYRAIVHHGRKGEHKGFREKDFAALLDAAHQQLGGPLVLVWDNSTHHVDTAMRALIAARSWLTVFRLPPYAPDLNPVEGIWPHLKRSLGNLAARSTDQLAILIKTRLKQMQYRPNLLNGFLAETGLNLEPS
jgi:DDE superfamily endonuclease